MKQFSDSAKNRAWNKQAGGIPPIAGDVQCFRFSHCGHWLSAGGRNKNTVGGWQAYQKDPRLGFERDNCILFCMSCSRELEQERTDRQQ